MSEKGKHVFFSIVVPSLMGICLVSALIYYNFIDRPRTPLPVEENRVNGKAGSLQMTSFSHEEIDMDFSSLDKVTLLYIDDEVDERMVDKVEERLGKDSSLQAVFLFPYECMASLSQKILTGYGDSRILFGHDSENNPLIASFDPKMRYPYSISIDREGNILSSCEDVDISLSTWDASLTLGTKVGNLIPEVTLESYLGKEDYSIREHLGKTLVINFWGTWCTPCVRELPDFARFASLHRDDLSMVAIHSSANTLEELPSQKEEVSQFLDIQKDGEGNLWKDYDIIFSQDTSPVEKGYYKMLFPDKETYPMTLVLDSRNIIRNIHEGAIDEETLEQDYQSLSQD